MSGIEKSTNSKLSESLTHLLTSHSPKCSLAHESLACVLSCSFCMLICSRVTLLFAHLLTSYSFVCSFAHELLIWLLICSRVTRTCAQLLISCLWVTQQHQNWQTHMAAFGYDQIMGWAAEHSNSATQMSYSDVYEPFSQPYTINYTEHNASFLLSVGWLWHLQWAKIGCIQQNSEWGAFVWLFF